jgi:hypothetical protein
MSENKSAVSHDVYSKMQVGEPVAIFKKTILAKVQVSVINPFNEAPEYIMLYGDPKKNHPDCFVEVWSQMEEVYFERINDSLFKKGYITKLETNVKPKRKDTQEQDYSKLTEADIRELVTAPFMKFKKELNAIDVVGVLYRIQAIAEEMERPAKTMENIQQRITELQQKE